MNNQNNSKNIKLLIISLLPLIFTITLFILSNVDNSGCDGMFGGLDGDCKSSNYMFWAFFSIPFAILSLLGYFCKSYNLPIVGALLFLGFNILLLLITTVEAVQEIEIVSIIFSGSLLLLEFIMKKKFNNTN